MILDVGCGSGATMKEYVKENLVVGIDIMNSALLEAKTNGLHTIKCDINYPLPIRTEFADVIVVMHVFEHVFDLELLIDEIVKALKRNGYLICAIPNHFDIFQRFLMLTGKGIIHWTHRHYRIPPWKYPHIRFLLLRDLMDLLRLNSLNLDLVGFKWIDAYTKPFSLIDSLLPPFLKKILIKAFPDLFSIEFIIRAKKGNKSRMTKLFLYSREYKLM